MVFVLAKFTNLGMKRILSFFVKYYLFWFCYFIFFKILFLLANWDNTIGLGWKDFWGVFIFGSKMDLSATGYFTLLPGVILFLSSFIQPRIIQQIIRWYTTFFLVVVTGFGLADIALYPAWGSRLNAQVLPYLENPAGIIACVNGWQIILFVFSEAAIVTLFLWLYRRFVDANYFDGKVVRWCVSPVMLFLTAALIIPIRGGFGTSPLNFSSVYFSTNLYANQSAYNFFWSFNYGILHNQVKSNPVNYFSEQECEANMKGVDSFSLAESPVFIKNHTGKPTNVILVILESFSDKVIEPMGGLAGITPRLNQFCKEGIFFPSFYATGNRSDKGLSSIIASYPALIQASSILYFSDKMKSLHSFPQQFKHEGYHFSFYYGGDVNFYNTRMLLMQACADKIISSSDFPLQISGLQKWGVPDQYLYDRMFDDLKMMPQPFLSMVYNISSHEPYDIPSFKRIKGNRSSDEYCNAIAYSDSCLGHFIDQLKSSPLWENTLVVITSDHTSLEPDGTAYDDPASYRIPLLWLGGVIDTAFVSNTIAMQTDIGSTLIRQMGWTPERSYFSKNIFGPKQYAFFFRDEGWGFLSPETGFFMNLESGQQRYFYGEENPAKDSLLVFSKSFTQYLHHDFLSK